MRITLLGIALLLIAADEPAPLTVDKEKRQVLIPAKVAPRLLDYLKDKNDGKPYPIEVIATRPHPAGQKAHETVLTVDVSPSDVHKALESLGLKPGSPASEDKGAAQGPEVRLFIEVPGTAGRRRLTLSQALVGLTNGQPFPKTVKFRFTGSTLSNADPAKPNQYGADVSGTLIAIFPVTSDTVIQSELAFKDASFLKLETNPKALPKIGTPVTLIIEAVGP
jgi:hypothetical protein